METIAAHVNRRYPRAETPDSLTYCEELDWLHGCWEALIGYRSSLGAVLARNAPPIKINNGETCSFEAHVDSFRNNEMTAPRQVMAKGRRVFQKLQQLLARHQIALSRYYEGRNVDLEDVKEAHRKYYEAKNG